MRQPAKPLLTLSLLRRRGPARNYPTTAPRRRPASHRAVNAEHAARAGVVRGADGGLDAELAPLERRIAYIFSGARPALARAAAAAPPRNM